MKNGKLEQAISNSWDWLSTWIDQFHGVHGYVVHHHKDNMKILSPDTWTQSACLLGCLNLYGRTKQASWLGEASKLGDCLLESYIHPLHVYANSNHEHKPLGTPSVISNALPSYALLKLSELRKERGLAPLGYFSVAEDNITKYLLAGWSSKVCAIDSLEQGKRHYVLNMNAVSAMTIATLSQIKGDRSLLEEYVKPICDFVISNQVMKGPSKGEYPYRAGNATDSVITLYGLITSFALANMFEMLGDQRYMESSLACFESVRRIFNADLGLAPHYHRKSAPYWLPDTALLYALDAKLLKLCGDKERISEMDPEKLLTMQYTNGGFPLSIGFCDSVDIRIVPSRSEIRRWRDILPTPNWNSWIFWFLTELKGVSSNLPPPTTTFPFTMQSDPEEQEGPYTIREDRTTVSFQDKRGELVALFAKSRDVAILSNLTERSENYRMRKMLDSYPRLLQHVIHRSSKLF